MKTYPISHEPRHDLTSAESHAPATNSYKYSFQVPNNESLQITGCVMKTLELTSEINTITNCTSAYADTKVKCCYAKDGKKL